MIDPISLEVFRHRFSAIAEEMGTVLMRSSYSPNIKERRDFSCALFSSDGEMVAQAAHIPVHLGSTPASVRAVMTSGLLQPGTTVMVNDPYAGGTHLPDMTLVTGVYVEDVLKFIVANRAHHADVGGLVPGSMGLVTHIDDEGFRCGPTVLTPLSREAFVSSSRTPVERKGDLRAQVAANDRGVARLMALMNEYPESVEYGEGLIAYGMRFMRKTIAAIPDGRYAFSDVLDGDGFAEQIPICCEVVVDGGAVTVDFSGSSAEVDGPFNVPRAVTVSAVMYVFRCLAPSALPTNSGYMRCIDVVTEAGTIVHGTYPKPVALGNVETSQRVVDVVLGALAKAIPDRIPAASYGSMNNVMIGGVDEQGNPFTYYETIAGGHGAGASFDGASARQAHMTNTLNTPIESIEHNYPFTIASYSIRTGSGGQGAFVGGDGVEKSYRFMCTAQVTVMIERVTNSPWGLFGGFTGANAEIFLVRDADVLAVSPKGTIDVITGDVLTIRTAGGGGYG